jgi:hypothetical protein
MGRLVVVLVRDPIKRTLAFALEVALRLELTDEVVPHLLEGDRRATKCVALVDFSEVRRRDLFKFLAGDITIDVEVTVSHPLGVACNTSFVALGKTIEEDVVAVNRRRDRLSAALGDGEAGTCVRSTTKTSAASASTLSSAER